MNGCSFQLKAKHMLSLNTGWVYCSTKATYDSSTGFITIPKGEQIECIRLKARFNRTDFMCFASEWPSYEQKDDDEKPPHIQYVASLGDSVSSDSFMKAPILADILREHSDLTRLPFVQRLTRYLPKDSIESVRRLATKDLWALDALMRTEPWELVFREPLHTTYRKLKPIPEERYYALLERYSEIVPPIHVAYAVNIYFLVLRNVEEHNHTCFSRLPYSSQEIPILQRATLEPMVFAYLETKAITWADVEHTKFALNEDHADAKTVCQALWRYHKNASESPPDERDVKKGVPCIPPTLTADQTKIAKHILNETVTVVEGLPGTGKTAIITWAVSHFSNVMLVTLTGMMTKSLQKRNGNRLEAAHTIHSVIYSAFRDGAGEWFAEFDVLIVDEFSNVDMRLFAKLLKVLPNIKRVVLVGDHEQIRPIKAGDPLGDMRDYFTLFKLTEILRVDPKLRDLAMAPKLIIQPCERNDGCKQLNFTNAGPLRLVPKKVTPDKGEEDYESTLRPILEGFIKKDRSLMNHHIIVLQHTHRVAVNKACLKIFESLNVFRKNVQRIHVGSVSLFVGCKITFTRNYNKPFKYQKMHSCAVANGELAIVTKMVRFAKGIYLHITDSDNAEEATNKTVICSSTLEHAVSLMDIDLGFATTTTAVQGREFQRIVFWNNTHPAPFWYRSHAFVAVSRGKQESVVVGSRRDFETICMNKDRHRRTILREVFIDSIGEITKLRPLPSVTSEIHAPETLHLTHKPCAPILADRRKEKKRRKKEEEEEDSFL